MPLKITTINDRKICVGGIGEVFYQDGFPISMSIDILKDMGVEVSVLNVVDELYKNGWTKKRIVAVMEQEIEGCSDMVSEFIDLGMSGERQDGTPPLGKEWIYSKSGYELQREAIFKSLFENKETALAWVN